MVKVRWVEWGLCARFGDTIELHKDLKKFPSLYQPMIEHENAHDSGDLTWNDIKVDLLGLHTNEINRLELFKFQIVRPKTWISILPFYYQKSKGFVIDYTKTLIYVAFLFFIIADLSLVIKLLNLIKGGG